MKSAIAFVIGGVVLFFAFAFLHDARGNRPFVAANATDFREFYCAGEAVLAHADPYRVEPLRSCIHRVAPGADPAWLVVPAPLPGYDLALMSAFAKLPFDAARFAWEALLVTCVLVAAAALALLIGRSPFLVALVFVPTVGFLNLGYGDLPPIVVAALCVGALALERGKVALAAVCVGIALIEPHIGLPALLALFVAVPRARVPAVAVASAIAVASVIAIGPAANVEYVRFELPAQALSEAYANDQYSLTRVATFLGVSASLALALGGAWYVAMVALGCAIATRLGRARRLAYVLLVPPAAVALGGSFVHDIQTACALPCALLLLADVPKMRAWCVGAILLLLLPATSHRLAAYPAPLFAALLACVALVGTLAEGLTDARWRLIAIAQVTAFAIVAMVGGVVFLKRHPMPPAPIARSIAAPLAIAPTDFAPVVWGAYLRAEPATRGTRYIVEKIPVWFGLIVVIAGAAVATRKRRDVVAA